MRLPQEEFRVAIRKTAPCFIPQFSKRHTGEELVDENTVGSLFRDLQPKTTPNFLQEEEYEDEHPNGLFECEGLSDDGHVGGRSESEEASEDGHDSSPSEDENAPKPPFLIGEEKEDEVGLSDGNSIFIDDVLEEAERCVFLKCGVYSYSDQNL
jgi:hypothetical protein